MAPVWRWSFCGHGSRALWLTAKRKKNLELELRNQRKARGGRDQRVVFGKLEWEEEESERKKGKERERGVREQEENRADLVRRLQNQHFILLNYLISTAFKKLYTQELASFQILLVRNPCDLISREVGQTVVSVSGGKLTEVTVCSCELDAIPVI